MIGIILFVGRQKYDLIWELLFTKLLDNVQITFNYDAVFGLLSLF